MIVRGQFLTAALLLAAAMPVAGQDAAVVAVPAAPVPPIDMLTVPALSLVTLQVDDFITSKTAKRGDHFGVTMLNEISVDGVVVVPRGSHGEGEVIHAASIGFAGKPGELILVARFLTIGGTKLPLQGFKISKVGSSNTELVSFGTGLAILEHGTNTKVPVGQIGIAKTAQPFSVPRPTGTLVSTAGNTTK